MGDPDRFYHLRLSQLMADNGSLSNLPQIEDLDWGNGFAEKEWLFHQLTAAAYGIGGETGVLNVIPLLFCLAGSLLLLCGGLIAGTLGSFYVFLTTSGLIGLNSLFVHRMTLLRPQLLAVVLFLVMILCSLGGWIPALAVAAAAYTLAYHAFYVPLAFVVIFFACRMLYERKYSRAPLIVGMAMAAGICLNPHFPKNVIMTLQHLRIATLSAAMPIEFFGRELMPLRSDQWIQSFGGPLFVTILGGAWLLTGLLKPAQRTVEPLRDKSFATAALVVTSLFFMPLCLFSPRAIEYIFPITTLLAVGLIENGFKKKWLNALIIFAVYGLTNGKAAFDQVQTAMSRATPLQVRINEMFLSIDRIPQDAGGAKIFNCDWDISPFIFYRRPHMRVVDILDPSFLQSTNEVLYQARMDLLAGKIADPYFMLKDLFHADYVVCKRGSLGATLEGIPEFTRLFPVDAADYRKAGFAVYKISSRREHAGVEAFRYGFFPLTRFEDVAQVKPLPVASLHEEWVAPVSKADGVSLDFFDLFKAYAEFPKKEKYTTESHSEEPAHLCAEVTPKSLSNAVGADTLILGGGIHVRLWRNGKPLFQTGDGFFKPSVQNVSIPLSPPIRADDELVAIVCSPHDGVFAGIAMAFWEKKNIQSLCLARNQRINQVFPKNSGFAYSTQDFSECIAMPSVRLAQ